MEASQKLNFKLTIYGQMSLKMNAKLCNATMLAIISQTYSYNIQSTKHTFNV